MFKLSEVQKLNQFHLFTSEDKTGKPDIVFSGWTKNGLGSINYTYQVEQSLFGDLGSANKWINVAMSIAGDAILGTNVAAVDVAKKNVFTGSKPLVFDFDVYLFFTGESTYEKEILEPLEALISRYLPTANNDNIAGTILDSFKEYSAKKAIEKSGDDAASGNKNSTGGIWELAYKFFAYSQMYIGEVNTLKLPPIYDPNKNLKVGVVIGKENHWTFKARELQWTQFNVTFPPLVYSDEEGMGIFDHVKIHMQFKTLRNATTNMTSSLNGGMFNKPKFGKGMKIPSNTVSFM